MTILTKTITTPVGEMEIGVDANTNNLVFFDFKQRKSFEKLISQRVEKFGGKRGGDHPLFDDVETQIGEYFSGKRKEFDIPLQMIGTDFQIEVWQGLKDIPYGETWSYGQLAEHLGRTKYESRAVGTANGKNVFAIIVPCHRVIGANGNLIGYGGGLHRKEKLLKLEFSNSNQASLADYDF